MKYITANNEGDLDQIPSVVHGNGPIVFVDDDVEQHTILEMCYAKSEKKNKLLLFQTGEEVLSFMERVAAGEEIMPEVLFLDINMPGLNGFDVLRTLRKKSNFSEIPVIIMFSSSELESAQEFAKSLRANGYLVKPETVTAYVQIFNRI